MGPGGGVRESKVLFVMSRVSVMLEKQKADVIVHGKT